MTYTTVLYKLQNGSISPNQFVEKMTRLKNIKIVSIHQSMSRYAPEVSLVEILENARTELGITSGTQLSKGCGECQLTELGNRMVSIRGFQVNIVRHGTRVSAATVIFRSENLGKT